jgi:hypothetical protein
VLTVYADGTPRGSLLPLLPSPQAAVPATVVELVDTLVALVHARRRRGPM